jgi:hypothetical protein
METPDSCGRVLQETVTRFLGADGIREPLHRLQSALPDGAVVYVVGGAVRNLLIRQIYGTAPPTEDIDLFIGNVSPPLDSRRLFPGEPNRRTELGGIRWHPTDSGLAFDICRLQDFVIFAKYRLAATLENLLQFVDFDINSIAFDINARQLHERNCFAAIRRRRMDFNSRLFYNKESTAYRALLLRFKIEFALSRDVFNFLKNDVDLNILLFLKRLYRQRQGRALARRILTDYDRICGYADYPAYLANAPEAVSSHG